MDHEITFRTKTKNEQKILKAYLGNFDFDSLRPMANCLNIIEGDITRHARIAYIDSLLEAHSGDDFTMEKRHNLAYGRLLNMVIQEDQFKAVSDTICPTIKAEQKQYDKHRLVSTNYIKTTFLPHGRVNALLPYGTKSYDTSYLYERKRPKNQADAIYLGKISLNNMINYASYNWEAWRTDNWGYKEKPTAIKSTLEDNDDTFDITFHIDDYKHMFIPFVKYIIKDLSDTKIDFSILWRVRYETSDTVYNMNISKKFSSTTLHYEVPDNE